MIALGLAFSASAHPIEHARRLFATAKYGEAHAAREHHEIALQINPKSQASQRALDALK